MASTLTSRQIREARHMLGWTQDKLGSEARVEESLVAQMEVVPDSPGISLFHVMRIQAALEHAGIRFGQNGAVLMSILESGSGMQRI